MKKKGLSLQQWSRCRPDDSLLTRCDRKARSKGEAVPYRSGVVPFQLDEAGDLSILLVTSRKGGRWMFPKGNIAGGSDSLRSAVKEACEEAGVLGNALKALLGIAETSKHEFIEFYPLEITQILPEWEESSVRSRLFFSPEEAFAVLECREERAVLEALLEYVKEYKTGFDGNLTEN